MKFGIAIALASTAVAQKVTTQECWYDEGAQYTGKCNDLFFSYCDEYLLFAADTCNIFTFSRSAIKTLSNGIDMSVWVYERESSLNQQGSLEFDTFEDSSESGFGDFKAKLKQEDGEDFSERFEDEFEFDWEGCEAISDIPTPYRMGETMTLRGNTCAFRYQVTNRFDNQDYTFKVVRDGAAALALASTAILGALAI